MTALAALLVEAVRRCVEVLGDEELCKRVITIATEAVANGRVYVHGRPARMIAWSATTSRYTSPPATGWW
jgi:hypothetical protein